MKEAPTASGRLHHQSTSVLLRRELAYCGVSSGCSAPQRSAVLRQCRRRPRWRSPGGEWPICLIERILLIEMVEICPGFCERGGPLERLLGAERQPVLTLNLLIFPGSSIYASGARRYWCAIRHGRLYQAHRSDQRAQHRIAVLPQSQEGIIRDQGVHPIDRLPERHSTNS